MAQGQWVFEKGEQEADLEKMWASEGTTKTKRERGTKIEKRDEGYAREER